MLDSVDGDIIGRRDSYFSEKTSLKLDQAETLPTIEMARVGSVGQGMTIQFSKEEQTLKVLTGRNYL